MRSLPARGLLPPPGRGRNDGERGFVLILTFMLMTALIAIATTLLYMMTAETRGIGYHLEDYKLLDITEAGVERAKRAIRDDVLTTTDTGVADLRGNTTTGTAGADAAERDRVRYFNESTGTLILTAVGAGTNVILNDFDLNYLNTRISAVKLGARYKKNQGGGTSPTLTIEYTTNGIFPEAGNSSFTTTVTAGGFNSNLVVLDITNDRTWTWSTINSANFQIRATASGSDTRSVEMDYLFLQVTYEIDTLKEAWASGFTNITLGDGEIESVSITDESGKVHLNYASQSLLRYLMVERGIADGTANTVATNIVTYRGTNSFDTVEELQQVTGVTSTIYDAIKDYVTVYSYINTSATRPTGSRAPVNINTASREVLEALFDGLGLGATDPASLADDIIRERRARPFTAFYSSDSGVKSDFYDFVTGQTYLTTAEEDVVLNNADASQLIPSPGGTASDAVSTEFSYESNAFKVESVGLIEGRRMRVKRIIADSGSYTLTTYVGDTTSTGYFKRNYE